MANKLTATTVEFDIDGNHHKFEIVHSMPKKRGLSINDAVDNWVFRTKDFTAESLCEYINSKNGFQVAMPKNEFDNIIKQYI